MIVVDTQAVIWLTEDQTQLSAAAERALSAGRRQRELAISDVTLHEIAMLVARRRVTVRSSLETYLEFIESLFYVLPVTARIAARAQQFGAAYPKDPSDRLIGATAIMHGAQLVTKDKKIRESGEVNCVW